MKPKVIACIFLIYTMAGLAQSHSFVYEFLTLPASSLAAGLGGNQIANPEQDPVLSLHNPALLSEESHNNLVLNYMNYVSDIHFGSAFYSRKINNRSSWMTAIRYLDYGQISATDEYGNALGSLPARDMTLTGGYAFLMAEGLRGGINANIISSVLDEYTSLGLGIDLGLYYFNEDKLFYAGMALKNLGRQFIAYDEQFESLPWDMQIGICKKLEHAPFRFSLCAERLWEWDIPDAKWHENLLRHFIVGVEFLPSDAFHINFGYNIRRRVDLSIEQRNLLSGMSAGCSFIWKQLRFGAAYAKYHLNGNSLSFSISTQLGKTSLL